MKIIKKVIPWWVGKQVECKTCGQIVELEEGDEGLVYFKYQDNVQIELVCTCCNHLFRVKREI